MTTPLTPPPTAPSRSDSPATFSDRADALVAWLPTFVTEMDAATAALNAGIVPALNYGNWSALTGALSPPASVIYDDKVWVLNTATTNVAADQPGVSTKWTLYVRTETTYTVTGTTPALSPANGTIQSWTLSANSTPTISMNSGQSFTLRVNDGTGYTITNLASLVTWIDGSPPTLANTGWTWVEITKVDTTVYGALVGYST